MIDFESDETGDLVLSKQEIYPQLNINWFISEFPIFELDFLQEKEKVGNEEEPSFQIDFLTKGTQTSTNKKIKALTGNDELKQRIAILLKTESGDVPSKKGFGSQLYLSKHSNIDESSTIETIKDCITAELKDIVKGLEVKVTRAKGNGTFYASNLNIYIFSKGSLLYDFDYTV